MENSSSVFKKIDEFVFGQVENFKNTPTYQQFIDQFSGQDDFLQKNENHIFAILVVLIPLILIAIIEIQNFQLSKTLDIKRDIYTSLGETSIQSKRISLIEKKILGPRQITSQSELQGILNQIIKSVGITGDKIKISQVTTAKFLANVGRLSATIKFNGFSTPNFTNLLKALISKEKMVVPKLLVKRNKSSELLEGEINIYHHYRLK